MTAKKMSTPQTSKRIYCVVASTVQTPLQETVFLRESTKTRHSKLQYTADTRTVVQPAGRLIAQAAHVVSKARCYMLVDTLLDMLHKPKLDNIKRFLNAFTFEPVTTIILSARDSFELYHVLDLLCRAADVKVHTFLDYDQPDYGDVQQEVMTAIATEPVSPEDVVGILDYLPLWGSQYTK